MLIAMLISIINLVFNMKDDENIYKKKLFINIYKEI